ncbi:MAG: hypothetical protein AAGC57_11495 [Pseudomonadota bacterium]
MATARGKILDIAPDPGGFEGRYRAPGMDARFQADRRGDQAEAVLDINGRAILLQITPLPFGAEIAYIPFASDGTLVLDDAQLETFLRDGLSLPELPEGWVEAPRDARTQIAGNSFLASYEFWRPVGVRNGYVSLAPRIRTLMRMFPAVQLDVIWKLCLAPRAEEALAIALRGEGVDCAPVIDAIAAAQSRGRFDRYKDRVGAARDELRIAVRCAEKYVMSAQVCADSARRLAERATALQNAGTALRSIQ